MNWVRNFGQQEGNVPRGWGRRRVPAAPLFPLMHGKDVMIPKGTNVPAFCLSLAIARALPFRADSSKLGEVADDNYLAKSILLTNVVNSPWGAVMK